MMGKGLRRLSVLLKHVGRRRRVSAGVAGVTDDAAAFPGTAILTVRGDGGMDHNICWPLAHNMIRRNDKANTFGLVRHKADGSLKPHQGWDLEAPIGTPCFAISDGRIALVYNSVDYGDVIVLSFPFNGQKLYAAYAHLSAVEVAEGQSVTRGQRIGLTGDSGNARGMTGKDLHLHFEIRTMPRPGVGLGGRVSPLQVFGQIPLAAAIEAACQDG